MLTVAQSFDPSRAPSGPRLTVNKLYRYHLLNDEDCYYCTVKASDVAKLSGQKIVDFMSETKTAETLFEKLKPQAFWLFVVVGLACLAGGFHLKKDSAAFNWSDFLILVGTTVLASGVFAGVLKTIQFAEVFRHELSELFKSATFADHMRKIFLNGHSDVGAFERILSHSIQERLPMVAGKIPTSSANFLKANFDYYFRDYSRVITVESFDPATGIVVIDDRYHFNVTSTCACKFESKFSGITYNQENGVAVFPKFTARDVKAGTDHDLLKGLKRDGEQVSVVFPLLKNREYRFDRNIRQTFRLSDDPMVYQQFKRVCDGLHIQIVNRCPARIAMDVVFTNVEVQPKPGKLTKVDCVEDTYAIDGLTFPHQGYIVTFVPL